jgi:hypothetical protein
MKCRWNRTMLNLCGIVAAILNMATAMWVDNDVPNWLPTLKNFYRSPFSKWSPQYRTNSTLSDFNAISYVGRLWCPELIPDINKFLMSAINSGHHYLPTSNFDDIGQCWIFAVLWRKFWKWRPVEIVQG